MLEKKQYEKSVLVDQKEQKQNEDDENDFHQHLSKFSCLMIGIGGLVGGGIFSVIGAITEYTGPYTYLSYLITGIITLFTVYSYHKLNSKWCNPGGEFTCIQEALSSSNLRELGKFAGLLIYFGYIATMALYAYTFSVYFIYLFNLEFNFMLISFIVIIIFIFITILNLKGVKESSRLQNILVISILLILSLFITSGLLYSFGNTELFLQNEGFDIASLSHMNFLGILLGSASIIISYEGFQLIAYGSHEMKDREKGLSMMKWSLVVSIIVYILTAISSMAILGVSGILNQGGHLKEVSIAVAAEKALGIIGLISVIVCALLATLSAMNATIIGSSRLAYKMAKDKLIPSKLSKMSKNKVPYNSIILTSVLGVLLTIFTGGALAIAGVAGLIFAQIFFIINFSNYKARKATNSNTIFPLIGMAGTSLLFMVLFLYSIINIRKEVFSLTAFFLIEISIFIFLYRYRNKT